MSRREMHAVSVAKLRVPGGAAPEFASRIDAARGSTIDCDADSGDERGARRYQEAHEIGNVLGGRDPTQRITLLGLRAEGLDRLAGRGRLLGHQVVPSLR